MKSIHQIIGQLEGMRKMIMFIDPKEINVVTANEILNETILFLEDLTFSKFSKWESKYKTCRAVFLEMSRRSRKVEREWGKDKQRLAELKSELETYQFWVKPREPGTVACTVEGIRKSIQAGRGGEEIKGVGSD